MKQQHPCCMTHNDRVIAGPSGLCGTCPHKVKPLAITETASDPETTAHYRKKLEATNGPLTGDWLLSKALAPVVLEEPTPAPDMELIVEGLKSVIDETLRNTLFNEPGKARGGVVNFGGQPYFIGTDFGKLPDRTAIIIAWNHTASDSYMTFTFRDTTGETADMSIPLADAMEYRDACVNQRVFTQADLWAIINKYAINLKPNHTSRALRSAQYGKLAKYYMFKEDDVMIPAGLPVDRTLRGLPFDPIKHTRGVDLGDGRDFQGFTINRPPGQWPGPMTDYLRPGDWRYHYGLKQTWDGKAWRADVPGRIPGLDCIEDKPVVKSGRSRKAVKTHGGHTLHREYIRGLDGEVIDVTSHFID